MIFRKRQPKWAATVAGTGWGESTYAELAWDRSRGAAARWAVAGAVAGAKTTSAIKLPATAPATAQRAAAPRDRSQASSA